MADRPRYPGIRITTKGNQLVGYYAEARITEGGVLYSNTTSSERDEYLHPAFADGKLDAFGEGELEGVVAAGEDAAQRGAITFSVAATRTADFTCGQGVAYGLEDDWAEARI